MRLFVTAFHFHEENGGREGWESGIFFWVVVLPRRKERREWLPEWEGEGGKEGDEGVGGTGARLLFLFN